MNFINWYPGHIAKAQRELKSQLSLIDVVLEVRDARLPQSSAYPDIKNLIGSKPKLILFNKSDLCDIDKTTVWINYLEQNYHQKSLLVSTLYSKDVIRIVNNSILLGKTKIEGLVKKGLSKRAVRVMVIGMPNVGKSSIINRLVSKSKTKVGAKAGVTRQQQWVKIHSELDLLDTAGIIPFKLVDQKTAQKLAMVNGISENAYDKEFIATKLLELLNHKYPNELKTYYKIDDNLVISLNNIAIKRNWVQKAQQADILRTANRVLKDFRDGKIGKFTLDEFEK